MTTADEIESFKQKWQSEHPDKAPLIEEAPPGERRARSEYITMQTLGRLLRVHFTGALRILYDEGIPIRVRHEGRRVRYEIPASAIPTLLERHGSEEARQKRRERPSCRRGEPLPQVCRFCGKIGGQWRNHIDVNGLVHAMCSGCRKIYGSILLADGSKLACPKCGETDRQIRFVPAVHGLRVMCGHCRTRYNVRGVGPKSTRKTQPTSRPSAQQLELEHQLAIDEFFKRGTAASPHDGPQNPQPAANTSHPLKSGDSSSKQAIPV